MKKAMETMEALGAIPTMFALLNEVREERITWIRDSHDTWKAKYRKEKESIEFVISILTKKDEVENWKRGRSEAFVDGAQACRSAFDLDEVLVTRDGYKDVFNSHAEGSQELADFMAGWQAEIDGDLPLWRW